MISSHMHMEISRKSDGGILDRISKVNLLNQTLNVLRWMEIPNETFKMAFEKFDGAFVMIWSHESFTHRGFYRILWKNLKCYLLLIRIIENGTCLRQE